MRTARAAVWVAWAVWTCNQARLGQLGTGDRPELEVQEAPKAPRKRGFLFWRDA